MLSIGVEGATGLYYLFFYWLLATGNFSSQRRIPCQIRKNLLGYWHSLQIRTRYPTNNPAYKEADVRRPVFFQRSGILFLTLALLALFSLPGVAWGETLKVCQPNQCLYPDPDFAGKPIMGVPEGAAVNVHSQAGDWYKVEYQGKVGWIHRQAFPAPEKGSKFNLPGMLFGAPVKETSNDEAALAGKGFTPEIESSYRSKHPEMKFGEVDKVEANRVSPAQLQAFIAQGGLKP
jgi:hypothetical protein